MGPLCAVLAALGGYVGGPGAVLGRMLAILGRSWASAGGPGPLLEPILAVLGHSWGLCWRSWAALGAYVSGLRPLLGGVGALGRMHTPKKHMHMPNAVRVRVSFSVCGFA